MFSESYNIGLLKVVGLSKHLLYEHVGLLWKKYISELNIAKSIHQPFNLLNYLLYEILTNLVQFKRSLKPDGSRGRYSYKSHALLPSTERIFPEAPFYAKNRK